ncbi:unnamed protein product [Anisakis simplex]|uniref:Ovule protein n=1 Tax=Anisakis simplex TaxID=6269 RepID=A0A0M3JJF1_ANISI|nr:unnamed protein product [Anisakis simplex]
MYSEFVNHHLILLQHPSPCIQFRHSTVHTRFPGQKSIRDSTTPDPSSSQKANKTFRLLSWCRDEPPTFPTLLTQSPVCKERRTVNISKV